MKQLGEWETWLLTRSYAGVELVLGMIFFLSGKLIRGAPDWFGTQKGPLEGRANYLGRVLEPRVPNPPTTISIHGVSS